MKSIKCTLLATAVTAAFVLGSTLASAQDFAKKYGIEKDYPGPCSYASMSKKDYKGRTLSVITHAVPVMGEPTDLHAKQFEELTGATVNVVHSPFGDLFQRIMIPFQTGQNAYDVMFYGSLWIGDFHDYLAPVPEKYIDTPGMKDVTPTYRKVATWGNTMVQYTVDADRNYMKYRRDVFENPAYQKKFKEKTGHTLAIPKTWEDYDRIANFFNGWDWAGDGKLHYGSAEITKRDDLMFSAFIDRAVAYAKNPHVKGGLFFDLKTMKPLINTPGFVKGLEMFIKAKRFFPPGGDNFGLGDEIFSFGGGQTLMSYTWDDAFVQAMEPTSKIRFKVGSAPLPGSHEVWNRLTNKWEYFATPNAPAYVTWGWTSAVAKASKNKDMAFDFLCFFSNEANADHDLQIGRFGINPYRNAHFTDAFWADKMGWGKTVGDQYVKTLLTIDRSKNHVFDLRIPGVNQFMSSMATGVSEAMAGQKTAQQALDDVAKEWQQIVDRIGVDKERAAYANVVRLEDND
jgi:multiple sugar transport system substrate-binding protein